MRPFLRNRSGSSLVEFAIILPVGLILLAGGMETGREIAIARRTVRVARAAADLTSQTSQLNASGMTTVLQAAAATLAPFDANPLGIVVSELTSDNSGKTTVTWSQALNAAPLSVGASMSVPDGIAPAGTSVILGQAMYAYTPTFGSRFVQAQTLSSTIYMPPRVSATVTYQ